ncbi:Skp1 protein [Entamoeba marina]
MQEADGDNFVLSEKVARQSSLITAYLNQNILPTPFVLHKVETSTMKKLEQWLTVHAENPLMYPDFAIGDRDKTGELHPWDEKFCDSLDKDTLFELLRVSNDLDIEMLTECTAKTIAKNISGKTQKELYDFLCNKSN